MRRTSGSPGLVDRLFAAEANGEIAGCAMAVRAEELRPGDYLPPQPCLDPTAWQSSGFRVGPSDRDICLNPALLPDRVLLFGPLGVLESLSNGDVVDIVRPQGTRRRRSPAGRRSPAC